MKDAPYRIVGTPRFGGIVVVSDHASNRVPDDIDLGIAPDLRMLDRDCTGIKNETKKQACYKETDAYFLTSIRRGKVRNGAVYMPPFEGVFNQEAMWAVKTYLESRRETN